MQEGGGKWGDAAVHTRRRDSPCNEKIQAWECAGRRGQGGDRRHSSVFIAPRRLRRGEIPLQRERPAQREELFSRCWSVAPMGATICKLLGKQVGGASAGAQSYCQGRFAACAFVDDFLGIGRPWNCWGVAPNPTRDAVPCPCKGGRKWDEVPPLTLFWLPGLVALPLLVYSLRFQALLALV